MSIDSYPQNPKKLRSPLLDGLRKNDSIQPNNKTKKIYFNLKDENNKTNIIDETLDNTLFCNKVIPNKQPKNNLITLKHINSLETTFKVGCILMWSCGGILCLLEIISILKSIQEGIYNYSQNVVTFLIVFVAVLIGNMICLGFIHLIKTTKYIFINTEKQKEDIEIILNWYKQK